MAEIEQKNQFEIVRLEEQQVDAKTRTGEVTVAELSHKSSWV